jgi:hypothetical protein
MNDRNHSQSIRHSCPISEYLSDRSNDHWILRDFDKKNFIQAVYGVSKSLTGDNLLISRGMSVIASFDDSYFSGYADLNLSILFPVNS